jgi:hypothetical protein
MPLPPTPIVVEALRETVGPPFLIGVGVLVFARLLFGKSSASVAAVVALTAALAVGNYQVNLNPNWQPTDKRLTWLPWLAAVGALAGVLIHTLKRPAVGHSLWAFVAVMAVLRVLPKDYLSKPEWHAIPLLVLAFIIVTAAVGFGLMKLSEKRPGALTPFLLGSALMAGGTVIIHAHSKSLLDVASLGGMCLFGVAAVAAVTKGDAGAVFPGAAFLLTGTLVAGQYETYSNVPTAAFVLPAVAPLLALVGLVPAVDRLSPRVRFAVVAVPTLVALAVAVGLAMANESLAFGDEGY